MNDKFHAVMLYSRSIRIEENISRTEFMLLNATHQTQSAFHVDSIVQKAFFIYCPMFF